MALTTMVSAVVTAISREGALIAGLMIGLGGMAFSISCLISLEVVEGFCPALRYGAPITVMWIKPVINVTCKVSRTMEPVASAEKHPVYKPIRSVVAVGRAVVWSVIEIPIGACRLDSNVDGDLGWRNTRTEQERGCEGCKNKGFGFEHDLSLRGVKVRGKR